MIRYLLDTSICIHLIRGRSRRLLQRLRRRPAGSVAMSSVTLAELEYGVAHSTDPARNAAALAHFAAALTVVPFDVAAASAYGPTRAALERQGTPIGPLDTLIAAHALSLGSALVTSNAREFARVAGLKVENWAVG